MKVKVAHWCLTLRPQGLYGTWDSPGKNTGVGSHSLLQGNLPTPGIEPSSPTLQADSLPSEPPGKPLLKVGPSKFYKLQSYKTWGLPLMAPVSSELRSPKVLPVLGESFLKIPRRAGLLTH